MRKEGCYSPWEGREPKERPFSEVRRLTALGHRLRAGRWVQGGGREWRWTLVTQVHHGRKQACGMCVGPCGTPLTEPLLLGCSPICCL